MRLPSNLSWNVIFLIVLLLLLDTFAQIVFKIGVTHLGEFPTENLFNIWKYCMQLALNPFVISGLVALCFAFFIWLILISKVDLSFAHPMTSLVYATIPLSASWILNEPIHWNQLVGIVIIVIGVYVVSDDASKVDS